MNEKDAKEKSKTKKTSMTTQEFFAKELPILSDIVSFAGNLPMSVYTDSTVVKTGEVVYRGLVFSKTRLLSEYYLLNFRRSNPDMAIVIGVNNFRMPMVMGTLASRHLKEDTEKLISLPKYKNINAPIGSVIRSRRSIRKYSGHSMSLEDLATILFYGQGVSGKLHLSNMPDTVSLGKNDEIDLRTAPSGGGLNPIDLYIIAENIEGLDRGGYLYLPQYHALKTVKKWDTNFNISQMGQFGEIQVLKSNFLLVFAYNLYENSRKYGDPGLAYGLIEAGEISENIHLICTAMGIGPCDVGGYAKHRLEENLSLDGLSQHVIHLTVIGKIG
ncbi:MAG: SagB/ThcOx family dehydrogenase [Acidobacteria bacterium]|jgi:SagB-type dehydrogenase family enzyme|nr:SagB/ThcOx family dehydrogenase [Acidobacteriota bacterium]